MQFALLPMFIQWEICLVFVPSPSYKTSSTKLTRAIQDGIIVQVHVAHTWPSGASSLSQVSYLLLAGTCTIQGHSEKDTLGHDSGKQLPLEQSLPSNTNNGGSTPFSEHPFFSGFKSKVYLERSLLPLNELPKFR